MREDYITHSPERDAHMAEIADELSSLSDEISANADYEPTTEDAGRQVSI